MADRPVPYNTVDPETGRLVKRYRTGHDPVREETAYDDARAIREFQLGKRQAAYRKSKRGDRQ
ncbi:MAG TPA: hypothetical protein VF764_05240 [Steroidobacteraceae bacterium]